jgi:hypothetical protein
MRRKLVVPVCALMLMLGVLVTPGAAITGGQADGNRHPYTGLLLAPGLTFCTGTLISADTILTAGHCTSFWDELADEEDLETIMVSFDPQASVDEDWMPDGGTWYPASNWITHPDYVDAEWPFTWDYGLLYLDGPVGITPGQLPAPNMLTPIISSNGQTQQRFTDVGYGVQGTAVRGGLPGFAVTWTRKYSVQRYHPGNGSTSAILHPAWFILNNQPSPNHGGPCGGDSGSPVLWGDTNTQVAVHVGGYRLGPPGDEFLCGRLTALNMRIDLPSVLAWITAND